MLELQQALLRQTSASEDVKTVATIATDDTTKPPADDAPSSDDLAMIKFSEAILEAWKKNQNPPSLTLPLFTNSDSVRNSLEAIRNYL